MNLTEAIEAMKAGKRVKRAGWNSTNSFIEWAGGRILQINEPDHVITSRVVVPWTMTATDEAASDYEVCA